MNNISEVFSAEFLGFSLSIVLYLLLMISVLGVRNGSGRSNKRNHLGWNG